MTTEAPAPEVPDYPLIIATLNSQTQEARIACCQAVLEHRPADAHRFAVSAHALDEQTGVMLRAWSDSLRNLSPDDEWTQGGDPWCL